MPIFFLWPADGEAICTGTDITSHDILADPRFDAGWRDLCLRSGIKAIRSKPIRGEKDSDGTFVLAFKESAGPERWDDALMMKFSKFAADAIEIRGRNRARSINETGR